MKSVLILLSFLQFFNGYLQAQIPKANIHAEEYLYYDFEGDIKSCKIRNYSDDGLFHWSILNNTNQDLFYDKEKQLKERISYNIEGLGYSDSIYADKRWQYVYDKNNLSKVEEINIQSNEIKNTWKYKYLDKTSRLKFVINATLDTLSYTKTIKTENAIKQFKKKHEEEYRLSHVKENDKNKRLKSISTFDKEDKLKHLRLFTYDEDSLGSEIILDYQIQIKKKKIKKTITYKNEFGQIVKKIYLNDKDEMTGESYYEYTYDDKKNWIKRISKWRSGKEKEFIVHKTTRAIEYY